MYVLLIQPHVLSTKNSSFNNYTILVPSFDKGGLTAPILNDKDQSEKMSPLL